MAGFESAGALPADQQIDELRSQPPVAEPPTRTDWRIGTYGRPVLAGENPENGDGIRPFGSELFTGGGFSGVRSDGLSPDYRVVPGDQIT